MLIFIIVKQIVRLNKQGCCAHKATSAWWLCVPNNEFIDLCLWRLRVNEVRGRGNEVKQRVN